MVKRVLIVALALLPAAACSVKLELSGPLPPMCQGPVSGFDPTTPAAETCTMTLVASNLVKSSDTCYVDEVVTGTSGELVYPCAGGPATATFGDRAFFGEVKNGAVELCIRTAFPFKDGCDWQSAQHISGELTDPLLDYRYDEAPEPDQSGCARACFADADVDAQ